MPKNIPKANEIAASWIKLQMIKNGVETVNSVSEYSITVLNKMIDTASFTIPSPNTNEYSFGCFSYLTIETAAITSEEHMREHKSKISIISRSKSTYVCELYYHIWIVVLYMMAYVIAEKTVKLTKVPKSPNKVM
jgi:hypothetical protein